MYNIFKKLTTKEELNLALEHIYDTYQTHLDPEINFSALLFDSNFDRMTTDQFEKYVGFDFNHQFTDKQEFIDHLIEKINSESFIVYYSQELRLVMFRHNLNKYFIKIKFIKEIIYNEDESATILTPC